MILKEMTKARNIFMVVLIRHVNQYSRVSYGCCGLVMDVFTFNASQCTVRANNTDDRHRSVQIVIGAFGWMWTVEMKVI